MDHPVLRNKPDMATIAEGVRVCHPSLFPEAMTALNTMAGLTKQSQAPFCISKAVQLRRTLHPCSLLYGKHH